MKGFCLVSANKTYSKVFQIMSGCGSIRSSSSFSSLSIEWYSSRFEGVSVLVLLICLGNMRITIYCYGGSNILKTSEHTRPVRLGVWRIRLGRQSSKSKDKQ